MGKKVAKAKNRVGTKKPRAPGSNPQPQFVGELVIRNGGRRRCFPKQGKGGKPVFHEFRYRMSELRKMVKDRLAEIVRLVKKPTKDRPALLFPCNNWPQVDTIIGEMRALGFDLRQQKAIIEEEGKYAKVNAIVMVG